MYLPIGITNYQLSTENTNLVCEYMTDGKLTEFHYLCLCLRKGKK